MGNCIFGADSPCDQALQRREERERERGQALLRTMVTSKKDVDWQAVIAKAQELHAREQALIRLQKNRDTASSRRKYKRERARRKKTDSLGSFSVNILSYGSDGRVTCGSKAVDGDRSEGRSTGHPGSVTRDDHTLSDASNGTAGLSTSLTGSVTRDDYTLSDASNGTSGAELVFSRSWDEGMTPIDEQTEQF